MLRANREMLVAVGFEPTQPKLWQLECHPLTARANDLLLKYAPY